MRRKLKITQEELLLIRAAVATWCALQQENHAFDFEIEALESLKAKGVIRNYEFKKD